MDRSSIFWTAFWAGVASPVALYSPPPVYSTYSINFGVAQTFARVGVALGRPYREIAHDGRSSAPAESANYGA